MVLMMLSIIYLGLRLANLWKLLTSMAMKFILIFRNFHCLLNFEREIKEASAWGAKEHLMVDKMILCDSQRRHTNFGLITRKPLT